MRRLRCVRWFANRRNMTADLPFHPTTHTVCPPLNDSRRCRNRGHKTTSTEPTSPNCSTFADLLKTRLSAPTSLSAVPPLPRTLETGRGVCFLSSLSFFRLAWRVLYRTDT